MLVMVLAAVVILALAPLAWHNFRAMLPGVRGALAGFAAMGLVLGLVGLAMYAALSGNTVLSLICFAIFAPILIWDHQHTYRKKTVSISNGTELQPDRPK